MGFLRATDTISGSEGKAFATINGQVHDLFYIKKLEGTMEKSKVEIKAIGKRNTQNKTIGWSGAGSMTIYYMTSIFRKIALDYIKTGKDLYFTMTVVNEDPGSSVGKQTTVLYDCNLDSTMLANLDIDSDTLEEDMDFTFEDADILDEFGKPIN